eukprot:9464398-Pyramimonas_sp.AAC.2
MRVNDDTEPQLCLSLHSAVSCLIWAICLYIYLAYSDQPVFREICPDAVSIFVALLLLVDDVFRVLNHIRCVSSEESVHRCVHTCAQLASLHFTHSVYACMCGLFDDSR